MSETLVRGVQSRSKPGRGGLQKSRNGSGNRWSTATAEGSTTTSAEAHITSKTVTAEDVYLRGRVQNSGGGPLAHAKLTLFENVTSGAKTRVPLGSDGSFKAPVEMQKNYTFRADAEGYAPAISESITITTATAGDEVILVMNRGRRVSGSVVDAAGAPVPQARVLAKVLSGDEYPHSFEAGSSERTNIARVQTGADGTFTMGGLPPTMVKLEAESDAYAYAGGYRLKPDESDTTGILLQLPATGAVRGIVSDQDGDPVPGAEVNVIAGILPTMWRGKAETAPDGRFEFEKAPTSASVILSITKAGYKRYSKHGAPIDTEVSVTLHQNAACTVTVTCLDGVTMERVTSVALQVHNTDHNEKVEVYEVDSGLFEMESQINADMFIVGESEGYNPAYTDVIPKAIQENVQLLFTRPARISGRVIDAVSRKPVKGAQIYAGRQAVEGSTTGDYGHFEFTAKPEHYSYHAAAPDERVSKTFRPILAAGKTVDAGDIEVAGSAGISVVVVRGEKQEPVRGTPVFVRNALSAAKEILQQGVTNYEGKYDFDLKPRSRIKIELPEWNASTEVDHLPQTEARQVKIVVGNASIRGHILSNGKPQAGSVSGRHMQVANAQFDKLHVANDGKFQVENLLPGKWELTAGVDGADWMRVHRQVDVHASRPTEVTINVGSANRKIKGKVIDEQGNPIPQIRVVIRATNSDGGVIADDNGRFETWPVEPGKCDLYAVEEKLGRSKVVTVQVPEDDTEIPEMELVVKRGSGRVACTILSILDGLPIEGGSIVLEENGKSIAFGSMSMGGARDAMIENILAGDYTVTISAPGFERKTRPLRVEDNSDIRLVEVLSPAAVVKVHVQDANGYYASGVSVTLIPLDQEPMQAVRSATTDARGIAEFGPMPYGTFQVEAAGPNGGSASATISTMAQREVKADVVLRPAE